MVRNVLAVLAGLAVGMAFNMSLVMLNAYVLYPMPEGTTFEDTEKFQEYVDTLPLPAFLVVLLAHVGQAFFGGWLAARLAGSQPLALAMIVGALSMVGGILNMLSIQGPSWMWIEVPLYLVLAWVAGSMEMRRRAARAPAA